MHENMVAVFLVLGKLILLEFKEVMVRLVHLDYRRCLNISSTLNIIPRNLNTLSVYLTSEQMNFNSVLKRGATNVHPL